MGVKKFHKYLYGRAFSICTDQTPLLGLLGEHKAIPDRLWSSSHLDFTGPFMGRMFLIAIVA